MKRLAAALALLLLAALPLAADAARDAAGTTTICARTAGAKPYVRMTVTAAQLRLHLKRPADIIPASGPCPRSVMTASAGGTALPVFLTGEAESPAGDPVATGTASVRLRRGQGQVCYQLAAKNLPTANAMHIHRGAAGVAGPVVIPLKTPDAQGAASGCATAPRTTVAAILKAPAGYYLNVHTQEFAGGAIRGQLAGTSQSALGWVASVNLVGSTEPNAKGTATVRIRQPANQVCYRLTAQSITLPAVAAHIHRGGAAANGPVVVPFTPPDANGASDGCTAADAALINDIVANPAGFYVNVHTKEHPGGAMRAQLG